MVQTRWEHLNSDYSLLTRTQAMALDGHFVIEQAVRNKVGFFINFNGTAGVWRRTCIEDAGNWQADTLTEDLDLSYRAQLRGWRFVYLNDVTSPGGASVGDQRAEIAAVPVDEGGDRDRPEDPARTSGVPRFRSKLKIHATFHLTNNLVFPFIVLAGILNVPLVFIKHSGMYDAYFTFMSVFVFAFIGSFLFYLFSQRDVYTDWRRRLFLFPVFMAGSMGFAVNNSRAVHRGTVQEEERVRPDAEIQHPDRKDSWTDKQYVPVKLERDGGGRDPPGGLLPVRRCVLRSTFSKSPRSRSSFSSSSASRSCRCCRSSTPTWGGGSTRGSDHLQGGIPAMAMLDESAVHSFAREAAMLLSRGEAPEALQVCRNGVTGIPWYLTGVFMLGPVLRSARTVRGGGGRVPPGGLRKCPGSDVVQRMLRRIEGAEREEYEAFVTRRQQTLTVERDAQSFEAYPRPTSRRRKSAVDFLLRQVEQVKRTAPAEPPAREESERGTTRGSGKIVTPTLAEIYASQGEYEEAMKAYRKLMTLRAAEAPRFEKETRASWKPWRGHADRPERREARK